MYETLKVIWKGDLPIGHLLVFGLLLNLIAGIYAIWTLNELYFSSMHLSPKDLAFHEDTVPYVFFTVNLLPIIPFFNRSMDFRISGGSRALSLLFSLVFIAFSALSYHYFTYSKTASEIYAECEEFFEDKNITMTKDRFLVCRCAQGYIFQHEGVDHIAAAKICRDKIDNINETMESYLGE